VSRGGGGGNGGGAGGGRQGVSTDEPAQCPLDRAFF